MSIPRRARYGARDNSHTLLEWRSAEAPPPVELLGLTDKPPNTSRGERWWPSVGCGPLGDRWALWWTEPDEQSSRAGMVRSEVALWTGDEISLVDDLRPTMEVLSRGRPIQTLDSSFLAAVAEAILSPRDGRMSDAPVIRDLDAWPGILLALWLRLWPEARRHFSARVAVSPPQGGESVLPPWFVRHPRLASTGVVGHRVVSAGAAAPPGRAARWWVGGGDETMEEILSACRSLPADVAVLRRAARAAEHLDRLRSEPTAQHALSLLRTLITIAPDPAAASSLKREALANLAGHLARAPFEAVLSLANVKSTMLPDGALPSDAVASWITAHGAMLSVADVAALFAAVAAGAAEDWWRRSVTSALSTCLAGTTQEWAAVALKWHAVPEAAEVLRDLLPGGAETEARLLAASDGLTLPPSGWFRVREHAVLLRWPSLHAVAALGELGPTGALRAQRAFPHEPMVGIRLLVDRIDGPTLVEEAIANPDADSIRLLGRRTAGNPEWLRELDPAKHGWRLLWSAHLAGGGARWPAGIGRQSCATALLDAALRGEETCGLVHLLAEDIAESALEHPARPDLWQALTGADRDALLTGVASALATRCDRGEAISQPEAPLADAVLAGARRRDPSAALIVSLLRWRVAVGEDEFLRWIGGRRPGEWTHWAAPLGELVHERQWRRAARQLLALGKRDAEMRPAAAASVSLLPEWLQSFFSLFFGADPRHAARDDRPLLNHVAEVGATLAPERLDDIWERAGGKRKHLRLDGAPDARWRDAVRLASQGALQRGVAALVRELKSDFPHNPDVIELDELFRR